MSDQWCVGPMTCNRFQAHVLYKLSRKDFIKVSQLSYKLIRPMVYDPVLLIRIIVLFCSKSLCYDFFYLNKFLDLNRAYL